MSVTVGMQRREKFREPLRRKNEQDLLYASCRFTWATKHVSDPGTWGEPYNLKVCVVSHKPKNMTSWIVLWRISCRPEKKPTPAYFSSL